MKYAFELGHQPHISEAEIRTVLTKRLGISFVAIGQKNNFFIIETKTTFDATSCMHILGGTISINEYIADADNAETFIPDLIETQEGKIKFSIKSSNKRLGITIKKELKNRNRSVRYVEPKNTATIIHNNLVETKSNFIEIGKELYRTVAVQNIEAFTERDYHRPQADDKSGMLPPKLARIMINLSGVSPEKNTLLDAFCGSGTVLIEAIDLGFKKIIGSDLSKKAVQDSTENIQWFEKNHSLTDVSYSLHYCDATHTSSIVKKDSIDVLVSEPYLGKPLNGRETKEFLASQASELRELYTASFKEFKKILKKDARVIFIIPQFKYQDEWIVPECIGDIEKAGFALEPLSQKEETLLYHRPGQFVGRKIVQFVTL